MKNYNSRYISNLYSEFHIVFHFHHHHQQQQQQQRGDLLAENEQNN